ncbi:MAG TPA: phosphodiester glycosidase family protein [Propionibacteriaceae bacterium]|nr:phosphodiester glycosidase family protein [Propionibacteriaceae bacterium]
MNASTISRRTVLGVGLGAAAALGGTSAWALDRFVVDHVEVTDAAAFEAAQSTTSADATATTAAASATSELTDTTWKGADGSLVITKKSSGSGSDTVTWFEADISLTSASGLRSAFAQNKFGTNIIEVPSAIAERNNAVFAVNGDYYGFRDTGILIRNGVIWRDKGARQGLAFYADGTMKLYDETSTSAAGLLEQGVWQTLSFGPGMVENGTIVSGIDNVEVDTNVGNHSIQGRQPRTGIGLIDANRILIVVADGRSSGYSRGVTMSEFAQVFVDAGAQLAYNLDGGGSSVMYFNGALVNNPLGRGQERGTSDILFLA